MVPTLISITRLLTLFYNNINKTCVILPLLKKLQGYRIIIQKIVVFLYTNNKTSEKEIKKIIPFTIASKPTKYLEINLTIEVKDLKTT